jgi:hypothetical protein
MCNNCGDVGYTIEINDEGVEYMDSCFECFVEAHEADQEDIGAQIDRIMDKRLTINGRLMGIVDIAKMSDEERRRLAA